MSDEHPRIFISYSWEGEEHSDRVLNLANCLRQEGFDCRIDQFEVDPPGGFAEWMLKSIRDSKYVLIVITPTYRKRFDRKTPGNEGRGVKFESMLTQNTISANSSTTKFIPIFFSAADEELVPADLFGGRRFHVDLIRYPGESLRTSPGFVELLNRLDERPRGVAMPIGKRRPQAAPAAPTESRQALRPIERQVDFIVSSAATPAMRATDLPVAGAAQPLTLRRRFRWKLSLSILLILAILGLAIVPSTRQYLLNFGKWVTGSSRPPDSPPVDATLPVDLRMAIDLYGKGGTANEAEAKPLFLQAATSNDPLAVMWLARLYYRGKCGFKENVKTAQEYAKEVIDRIRERAGNGEPEAQYLFGDALSDGLGLATDENMAAFWFERAAKGGHVRAMNRYAALLDDGRGVAKDEAKAAEWFRKAAEAGSLLAMLNYGRRFANGRGVARDDAQALLWYQKAAEGGHTEAMVCLGYMIEMGRGTAKDDAKAVAWYRKAAEGGEVEAMANLGFAFANGQGIGRDDTQAVTWYQKAADAGNVRAMTNLGFMIEQGRGIMKNEALAAEWYRQAANAGSDVAMTNLARMFEHGRGIGKDEAKAVEWYQKAALAGNTDAMNDLGDMLDEGRGVAKDETKAIEWWRRAASQGNENAKAALRKRNLTW